MRAHGANQLTTDWTSGVRFPVKVMGRFSSPYPRQGPIQANDPVATGGLPHVDKRVEA